VRYRRYYTQRNKDGSRTVISVGPVAATLGGFLKFVVGFGLLAWPAIVCGDNLRGAVAWVVGVPSELTWLGILAVGYAAAQRSKKPEPVRPTALDAIGAAALAEARARTDAVIWSSNGAVWQARHGIIIPTPPKPSGPYSEWSPPAAPRPDLRAGPKPGK
jgi:hypothetical protein